MRMRLCVCGHPYDEPYHDALRGICAGCGCRSRRLMRQWDHDGTLIDNTEVWVDDDEQ